ncbi:VTC domain-containing protein [Hominenteromicrobium sp.]|uniref:VTC domain-containing protein n=1 Tax=Hominenteromicrobium sp. TaxID=3073581 RepID=UPI003AB36957
MSTIILSLQWSLHYYGDLKSAMALCYDRVALYSREDSGLRITFDTNIRFREENTDLRRGDDGRLLLEPGETLMEIKAGGGLPTWLTDMLSRFRIYPASFSKYASACNTHGTHIVHAS